MTILENNELRVTVGAAGIQSFATAVGSLPFQAGEHGGPQWLVREGGQWQAVQLQARPGGEPRFSGQRGELAFELEYHLADAGRLVVVAALRNLGAAPATGLHAALRLGVDAYMEKFPEWNEKLFPTLLRCEKTHFWGYFMSPAGRILGVSSPDPVASWHLDYKQGLHRIYTAWLDLLQPGPLPPRHPRGLDALAPGERKQWTICFEEIPDLAQVKPRLARSTGAPMIECDRHTVEPGGEVQVTVFGEQTRRETYRPGEKPGQYIYRAVAPNGKVAEATLCVRHPWSWYLKRARAEAIAKPQKGSSHTESWYGLFSCFAAREHFPDAGLDAQAEAKFAEIWPLMYDLEKMLPRAIPQWEGGRIQNEACAAGLLAARGRVTGDRHDLEFAASLVDFLLTKQTPDGAYRCGKVHYTSVVYIAKSIMEVMAEEKKLAAADPRWDERWRRHYASVRRAVDELARNLDNIQTEGEMTYEDGMIACSYTQLALFALGQADPAERRKYLDAALRLAGGHRCLSQILVPDGRMNGGSLRFWEAQYDVLTKPNMLNSPHGWSAWRIYGLWYLYLLTGREEYLRQAMDGLGSCAQLIDAASGELRWAFIPDPRIEAKVWREQPRQPGRGQHVPQTIGEQYLPMISGWYKAPPHTWVHGYEGEGGGCCDNDVHEIFKCLAEVALTAAYVVERENGEIVAWNCTVRGQGGALNIQPSEAVVSRIHLNLRRRQRIESSLFSGTAAAGMQWVGQPAVAPIPS
ncbi:MAG: hypothetical protein WC789_07730 [Lentisphaeria bacterium]